MTEQEYINVRDRALISNVIKTLSDVDNYEGLDVVRKILREIEAKLFREIKL